MENNEVKVGVAVFVFKNMSFPMLRRQGSHGAGHWSIPGGKLEFGESIEDCAARECREELGVEIQNPEIIGITNDIFEEEGKHYITVWVAADHKKGAPEIKEPEKCSEISWFSLQNLPEPLFLPFKNFIGTSLWDRAFFKQKLSRGYIKS